MRLPFVFAATVAMTGAAIADEHDYSHETNTYRFGGTYEVTFATDIKSCAVTCASDNLCKAWSFQRETAGLGSARCELKSTIGVREENALMTSGISPRLADVNNAPQTTDEDGQLLGGKTAAAVYIPARPPIITSVNANVTISDIYETPTSAIRTRLP
ncbi:MAG: PAN domain-containing protein [Pseudomonadota bacterium]